MKQFAFQISVKCGKENLKDCISIFSSLGYSVMYTHGSHSAIISYCGEEHCGIRSLVGIHDAGFDDRHYIDHFNPGLIRDIAAACTNDTWQMDEPVYDNGNNRMQKFEGDNSLAEDGHIVKDYKWYRRPTLAEICEHHGYEIKGRDIVKKVETVSNCHKSYCETARQLDEAKAEIKRLKSENAELSLKLEAMTDVDNQELARLQSKVDELSNKLQHNDKLHVKELEMLTDMITELSRDKAELIMKLNCLSAPDVIFHTSRPLEFHPTPNMFQTKPAEFSEREKKRLLRLAERIERLIK